MAVPWCMGPWVKPSDAWHAQASAAEVFRLFLSVLPSAQGSRLRQPDRLNRRVSESLTEAAILGRCVVRQPDTITMNDAGSSHVGVRVIYRGRVQGVGFRWTTARIARGFSVEGTVRNRSDGTVELVAQGDHRVVTTFLSEVAATMRGYIEECDTEEIAVREDLDGFQILR